MKILQAWKERHWQEATSEEYLNAYNLYGGSVFTHPEIIQAVSEITSMPLRYMSLRQHGDLVAIVPLWGKYIAGHKTALKKAGKRRALDTGNPEVILPVKPGSMFHLPFKVDFLSNLHNQNAGTRAFTNLKNSKAQSISLARPYTPGQEHALSKKFKYNRRRELRLFEEAGGEIRSVTEMDTAEFVETYIRLFKARWGFEIKGQENLQAFLERIRPHLFGHTAMINNQTIAIQLILMTESPEWISAEYINGGVDPEYNKYSPGSILSYINTQALYQDAENKDKQLRFSFGKSDREYKDLWCYRTPVFSISPGTLHFI